VRGHDDHLICLRGEALRFRKGLQICTVHSGSAWSVEVRLDSGQRARRKEVAGLSRDGALAQLRRLAAEL
jgi:hypothetical protein